MTDGVVLNYVAMFNRVLVLDPLNASVTCEEADRQPVRKCFVKVSDMFCGAYCRDVADHFPREQILPIRLSLRTFCLLVDGVDQGVLASLVRSFASLWLPSNVPPCVFW